MRWLWVAVATLGFVMAWTTKSPGVMALGFLLGLGGMFCAVLAFAAARIAANSRPDAMMVSAEELMQMRKRAEAQRASKGGNPTPSAARPMRSHAEENE